MVAIPLAFSNPKPLVCAVNPISGNISSLGIGGNIVSNNDAKNAPGYPYMLIHEVTVSKI